jgi:transcriptional regulator with XRE-family HTH domain
MRSATTTGRGGNTGCDRELTETIGSRIARARRENECSPETLAARAFMSVRRLTQIECGIIRPNASELWDLAIFLSRDISYFFADDETPLM